jgi:ubiquinone/menaquinone biosynthesis C-methylase UbiE
MKHFDKQAKNWDNDPKKNERAQIFAKEIIKQTQPKKDWNALEFGAGTGLLSYHLKNAFENITLADNSEGMIDVLKEKVKEKSLSNFKPLLVDLLQENINIGTFNVIYSLMTLHHINDLQKVAQIFNSLLKKDGFLCIADLVEEDGTFHTNHPDFNGHNGFNKEALNKILISNGFKIKHYSVCFEIEKKLATGIKKYPLFLMVCQKN